MHFRCVCLFTCAAISSAKRKLFIPNLRRLRDAGQVTELGQTECARLHLASAQVLNSVFGQRHEKPSPDQHMKIIDRLVKSLRSTAQYNSSVQVAPACILWTDSDEQWSEVMPRLLVEIPELSILGTYAPEMRTGPAIWLRCVIAGQIDEIPVLPDGQTPILYLPGVSRQDLRATDTCPENLKPLAELQYHGVTWTQASTKDWTILAYLKSADGGLGLNVAQDNASKHAMKTALRHLLDQEIDLLKNKQLDSDFFNTLLTVDWVRDLLLWVDQGNKHKAGRTANEWNAFVQVIKSKLAFNPETDGVLTGAAHLARHHNRWKAVWERFCEAPNLYPNIPTEIRKCQPPSTTLEWDMVTDGFDGWPQWNDDREDRLRQDLQSLGQLPPHKARKKLAELEKSHRKRRDSVWVKIGDAPLVNALEHLAVLAEIAGTTLTAGSAADLAILYREDGWKADDAVMRALSCVTKSADFDVVSTAVRSVYLSWLEESARYLQTIVEAATYPGGSHASAKMTPHTEGECVFFVDGLRFDIGNRLAKALEDADFDVKATPTWTALPSVTATGKPAVTPVIEKILGKEATSDFEPSVAATGQSLKGGYHLKRLLKEAGWEVLTGANYGVGKGNAWCEFGEIDHAGHESGWKLAQRLDGLVQEMLDRITLILGAGWKSVRVVTDHGWLLVPGGLPHVALPSHLSATKWSRCATVKGDSQPNVPVHSWHWNVYVRIASPPGAGSFAVKTEYSHGGVSPQECVVPELLVERGGAATSATIAAIAWRGMRCRVTVTTNEPSVQVDLRLNWKLPSTSIAASPKEVGPACEASIAVADDSHEGAAATVVVVDPAGNVLDRKPTTVGEAP